jgi:hypothetical protein
MVWSGAGVLLLRGLLGMHPHFLLQVWLSCWVVLLYFSFLSALFVYFRSIKKSISERLLGTGMLTVFLSDSLLRGLDHGLDLSLQAPGWNADRWAQLQYVGLFFYLLIGGGCAYAIWQLRPTASSKRAPSVTLAHLKIEHYLHFGALSLFFFLQMIFFLYPETWAHHTNSSYFLHYLWHMAVIILMIGGILSGYITQLPSALVVAGNVYTVCIFTLFWKGPHYLVATPIMAIMIAISLLFTYLNGYILLRACADACLSWKAFNQAFSLVFWVAIISIALYMHSLSWAYTFLVLRGKHFWLFIFALVGLSTTASYLHIRSTPSLSQIRPSKGWIAWMVPLLFVALVRFFQPQPKEQVPSDTLKVMTYNIHFGVGRDNLFNLSRIASNLMEAAPDIIALQEIELGNPCTQGVDMARWLAEKLGMYYYVQTAGNNPHYGKCHLKQVPNCIYPTLPTAWRAAREDFAPERNKSRGRLYRCFLHPYRRL